MRLFRFMFFFVNSRLEMKSYFIVVIYFIINFRYILSLQLSLNTRNITDTEDKIFFTGDILSLDCWLRDGVTVAYDEDSLVNWTWIVPTLTISNRSWSETYQFEPLAKQDRLLWEVDIPRLSFTMARKYWLPKGEWNLSVALHYNKYYTYTAMASLLDISTEPHLQWDLGNETGVLAPGGYIWYSSHSPCSADVSLVATLSNPGELYMSVTYAAYSGQLRSYTLNLCLYLANCTSIKIHDVLMLNHHLLVLTSGGVMVSNNLMQSPGGSGREMVLWSVMDVFSTCAGTRLGERLRYTRHCQSRAHDPFMADIVHVMYTCSLSTGQEESYVLKATEPFTGWSAQKLYNKSNTTVIDVAYYMHQDSVILLYKTQTDALGIHVDTKTHNHQLVEDFLFPSDSGVIKLVIEPISHTIFAYGTQIWYSKDGGNYFVLLSSLPDGDSVRSITFDHHGNKYCILTNGGSVFYSMIGLNRVVKLPGVVMSDLMMLDYHGDLIGYDMISETRQIVDVTSLLQAWSSSLSHSLVPIQLSDNELILYEYSGGDTTSEFTFNNVGQLLTYSGGCSSIIEDISTDLGHPDFLASITTTIVEGFITDVTTSALNIQYQVGDVRLELTSGTGWSGSDVGRCVMVPFIDSFIITSISSSMVALGKSPLQLGSTWTVNAGHWLMLKAPPSSPAWSLHEDVCHHDVSVDATVQPHTQIEMDIHENAILATHVTLSGILPLRKKPHFTVSMSNSQLVQSSWYYDLLSGPHVQNITVRLKKTNSIKGIFSVRVWSSLISARCPRAAVIYTVYLACPCRKRLVYIHPRPVTLYEYQHDDPKDEDGELLFDLPFNYRPPSRHGVAIPTSEHIYNADPKLPRPALSNRFQISKESGSFKQCLGKTSRVGCGCSLAMTYTDDAKFSDCKQRVSRLVHPGVLYPKFYIEQPDRANQSMDYQRHLIYMYEVNERVPEMFHIETSDLLETVMSDDRFSERGTDQWFQPSGIKLLMVRSGVYHYRVEIPSGYSFCPLYSEFQVYVDQTPIPYPVQHILRHSVALLLGGIMFFIYLWYLSNHHQHLLRPRGSQCQELQDVKYMKGHYLPSDYADWMEQ